MISTAVPGLEQTDRISAASLAYSVIIEWENVLLAGSSRALEMLRRLGGQMREMREKGVDGEVIIVESADEQAGEELTRAIEEFFCDATRTVRRIVVQGKRYYEKKNAGAAVANGDILVFLDSDVFPEAQWLDRLLGAFSESDAAIVAGATHIEPSTLYAKAVAAFWFFPPRSKEEGLAPADIFFTNNIAFRRQLFLRHPFPVLDQFRGQLGLLVRDLREKGVPFYLQRSARCAHPAPNGLIHFFRRAICEGHDNITRARRAIGQSRLPWRHTYWSVRSWCRSSFRAIRERRSALQLTPIELLAAWTLAICYIGIMALGEAMTRISPSFVARRFSI